MTAALIAKLESASEGSRELDVAVYAHVEGIAEELAELRWQAFVPFTTSIDAALALAERVLPDLHLCLSTCGGPIGSGNHCQWRIAAKWDRDFVTTAFGRQLDTGPIATPALAICAALLRASAAEGAG